MHSSKLSHSYPICVTLTAATFSFSDEPLRHLCGLEKLTSFAVTDCVITAIEPPKPLLGVTDIHLASHGTYGNVHAERGKVGWLDVLNPDTIRRIWISFDKAKIIHLRGIATTKSLYHLSAPEADNVNRHIISILSHPSTLEELHIAHYKDVHYKISNPPDDFEVGSLSLPSLRLYDGPHQYLSWFETGRSLHTVNLRAIDSQRRPRYIPPLDLQHTLEHQHVSDSIRSMAFGVTSIPDSLLMTIGARSTQLTDLDMSAKRVDEDQVSFFHRCRQHFSQVFLIQLILCVTSSLPPEIETVTLDIWHLSSSMTRVGLD